MLRRASPAVLLVLAACNDPSNDIDDGSHKPSPLPLTTSTASGEAPTYPPGPTDVAKGAVITNFEFPNGFPNAKKSSEKLEVIKLQDFWNPHVDDPDYNPPSPAEDDRLFPPGSPYGEGRPKPRALAIVIGSVWCGPCNEEAKSLLPVLHAKYAPCGGEFFFQLIEGQPGNPADEAKLRAWTKAYKVDYPAMIDPRRQLSNLYPTGNFPDSAIIDTRTMVMKEAIQGVADEAFWGTFEGLLDKECVAKP